MQDSSYTDPAAIRATYQARGRNAKLNIAKVESLGVNASQVSPTQGGTTNSGGTGAGLGGGGEVLDPTLYSDPGVNYDGSTYSGTTYKDFRDGFENDPNNPV